MHGKPLKTMAIGLFFGLQNLILTVFEAEPQRVLAPLRDCIIDLLASDYISSVYVDVFDLLLAPTGLPINQALFEATQGPHFINFSLAYATYATLQICGGCQFVLFAETSARKRHYTQKYGKLLEQE